MQKTPGYVAGAVASNSHIERYDQLKPTDDELKQQYHLLPSNCNRNSGILVKDETGQQREWDASLITLTHNGRTLLEAVASRCPTPDSLYGFWDLVSQYPGYLVCLACYEHTHYLGENRCLNQNKCPERGIFIQNSAKTALPESSVFVDKHDVCLTDTSSEEGKRMTIPSFDVSGWPGQKGLPPEALHGLVLTLKDISGQSDKPGVIHCHYGVGRTGVLIIAMALNALKEQGELTSENLIEILKELIADARETRAPNLIESAAQYISLYRYGQALCAGTLLKS